MEDIGEIQKTTTIYTDNKICIDIAKNLVFHARTKHIEVHYHFTWEKISNGTIHLQYVPTGEQLADIFTKPLAAQSFIKFRSELWIQPNDIMVEKLIYSVHNMNHQFPKINDTNKGYQILKKQN